MPSQLNLHVSNRLARLAATLAEVTARPLGSPFTPETVIVQSVAARRWLSLQLAELTGICANYEFPFLGEVVARWIAGAQPGEPAPARPESDALIWKIESALRRCAQTPAFASVAGYLADNDPVKRYALAERLAGLFDQYRIYRPELLLQWSGGDPLPPSGDAAWQASLWRDVDGSADFDRVLARLRLNGFKKRAAAALPARLAVFAPTAIAPAYLDLLFQLSRVCEVHLFVLRPAPFYRGDQLTPKARAKLPIAEDVAVEGNPLLSSWGKADAELTDLLLSTEERLGIPINEASETYDPPAASNLLTILQHDIYQDVPRRLEGEARHQIESVDRSFIINACHSPMREVEVLYDHLLDCFASHPGLRPKDILVMTPDIEKYGPLIKAVFAYPEDESLRIPYTIADRHPRSESMPVDTFLTLLELADTRYTAPDIFLLLSSRILRRRFGLTDDDLSLIRAWIESTAIRWGIDAGHKAASGIPAVAANTWRHGLDRLLLGFAVEGKERHLFAGILPEDNVEGDGAETLGRFITAVEALFALETTFAAARPLANWVEPLLGVVDGFLETADHDEVEDVRFLRELIERLRSLAAALPAAETVDFQAVRLYLEAQTGGMQQHGSFLSGSVTFCALKPVRSIPAEVICVLGLDNQVFPRRPHLAEFDLMADRRRGDPAPGADDRFAFLEILLSARQKLSVSYVGRSVQDNKNIPPSIVVAELCDYLDQSCQFSDGQSAEQFLVRDHPLHAFSSQYFVPAPVGQRLFTFAAEAAEQPRLFSYSRANAEASRQIQAPGLAVAHPFIGAPLPLEDPTPPAVELSALLRFWVNPAKHFVRRSLGMELRESPESLEADEPFGLSALDEYDIKKELLAGEFGPSAAGSPEAFAARGFLPPGAIGELHLRSLDAEVKQFIQVVRRHLTSRDKKQPLDVRLLLGAFTLSGRLQSYYGNGRNLHFRCATLKPKDRMRAWIEHLALCAQDARRTGQTILLGVDAVVRFNPVENAAQELETLCELFQEGRMRPLPFFPGASLEYVTAEASGRNDPFWAARAKWRGPWKIPGEKDDLYVARCFDPESALNDEFVEISRRICQPLLAHSTTEILNP